MISRRRKYSSESRKAQAELTRQRILAASKRLFSSRGFEKTTIDKIAKAAKVSAPTVYALFQSKAGILKALSNSLIFGAQYKSLVEKAHLLEDVVETLKMAPLITRTIYDAETAEMGFLWGASSLFPELKALEAALERQRFERQAFIVCRLKKSRLLADGMTVQRAREVLWALTSREIYRKLVLERGWSPRDYERWLRRTLLDVLVRSPSRRSEVGLR